MLICKEPRLDFHWEVLSFFFETPYNLKLNVAGRKAIVPDEFIPWSGIIGAPVQAAIN
jgi:hypothetical protein